MTLVILFIIGQSIAPIGGTALIVWQLTRRRQHGFAGLADAGRGRRKTSAIAPLGDRATSGAEGPRPSAPAARKSFRLGALPRCGAGERQTAS